MLTTVLGIALLAAPQANDLLPDITIWEQYLYDTAIDTTTMPGHTLLRLSTGTPNLGPGRLELRGGEIVGNQQIVYQRIYRTDNTFWQRPAGYFTYHAGHNHIHFDDWCEYRLREVLPGNGVGPVIRTGSKTSFCILDLVVYNSSIPGYNNPGYYSGCGAVVQGLTPGWADIYSKNLTGQWIDITGLPEGEYWLEAEVDPDGNILEVNKANNVGRVKVNIAPPPPTVPDPYEENDTRQQVDARPEAEPNSPNLGLVNARRDIDVLSMEANDPDWFKFRINRPGGPGDFVQINSIYSGSDLDMRLYNSMGVLLATSQSSTNFEQISMNGRPAGTYYVQVYPYSGHNPRYTFTIQPSGNQPPSVTVSEPAQDMYVERGMDTVPVAWLATDPENDPMFISLYRDYVAQFGKSSLPIEGYQNMPAGNLAANVNTAEMPQGWHYLHVRVSDGGIQTGTVAPGRFNVYVKGDLNRDDHVDMKDWRMFITWSRNFPAEWNYLLDMDRNGVLTASDIEIFRQMTHH
jgi:hypothetical protein